jgi:tRNA1Val (adenine37-N6)-methyltransferase
MNIEKRNSSFCFKQFAILQDKCAMKVGTDGILLGAWTNIVGCSQILDIGTGTGLLALMLAQRSQSLQPSINPIINAVEIDRDAYLQAMENIKRSPWTEQITVHHGSIQDFAKTCDKQYDLIIANPPFFENAYKSPQISRNLARHSDRLLQTDVLHIASQLLKSTGHLAVIYPTDLAEAFLRKAEVFGLFGDRKLLVKPTPQSSIKRILLELRKVPVPAQESVITIEVEKHIYAEDYIALVKDFYLKL